MLNLLQSRFPTLAELLQPELMAQLAKAGKRSRYGDGELIQLRGDNPQGFSIIESGQIIAGTEGADGSFLTAALLGPGDHVGDETIFAGLPRLHSLRAIGETEILHIPSGRFLRLFNQEPDVGRALLTIALRRIAFMLEFIDGQRRWPLPVRIAHLLLTSVEDRAQTGRHTITCRHEDLAEILGVSRVGVSKALKAMQAEGRITMRYGSIELNDVQQLVEWLRVSAQLEPIQPEPGWSF
ncbi:MAG: Crp/Fnr family transcriptional regulator [Gammaproteobacteria bacterium]|jgi:CRP/FNR family transcriptional regulator|nr:MAG: Crp/Fnr family transcriptional regulator [Gammaproteobacteria bacterium]